ncbi:hypothetical protein EYF80_059571 [Liparis tanakae]|uniref:Uncharacterized protein n=1 Tax=Liparis tanakae TaxID=230148 RepID=A0A4Z2ENC3_9TELE|nr:hypothetical protein EYF80_059571 [Liparis tanakae]
MAWLNTWLDNAWLELDAWLDMWLVDSRPARVPSLPRRVTPPHVTRVKAPVACCVASPEEASPDRRRTALRPRRHFNPPTSGCLLMPER